MSPKPVIHHRDHEHGGADPVRIAYESVGGGGGGGGYFLISGFQSSAPTAGHPRELLFTSTLLGHFHTSDAGFELDTVNGRVLINDPGGYVVLATVQTPIQADSSGNALIEIYSVTLRDPSGSFDIFGSNSPGGATLAGITDQTLLPGAWGFTPTLQNLVLFDVADDSAFGPYTFPLSIRLNFDWSAADTHDITYSLAGMRIGS